MKDNPQSEHNEDEIDVSQLLQLVNSSLLKFVAIIYSIPIFFIKKAKFFFPVIIIGIVIGYFIDKRATEIYYQDIIIEPKLESTEYLYKSIEFINLNLSNPEFFNRINITQEEASILSSISIEPIIRSRDVLDVLQKEYDDKNRAYNILFDFSNKILEDEKFKEFYTYHKITFTFVDNSLINNKLIDNVLNFIYNNDFYNKKISFLRKTNKYHLEENEKSLKFIDEYLNKVNEEIGKKQSFSGEKPIVYELDNRKYLTELLKQKERILENIKNESQFLVFNENIFSILNYGEVLKKEKSIFRKMIIIIPILSILVLVIFFINMKLYEKIKLK